MDNERIYAIVRELRTSAQSLPPGKRRDINNKLDKIALALKDRGPAESGIPQEYAEVFTNQTQAILAYLRDGHAITPMEALHKFGSFRLGARIADIEKLTGKAPNRRRVKVANASGKAVYVCQYWMEKEEKS